MSHFVAKFMLVGLIATATASVVNLSPPATKVAQANNSIQLSISPNQSRYPRGTELRITATVRSADGQRLANTPVLVVETFYNSGTRRTEQRNLGQFTTNNAGRIAIDYRISTDPNQDKVTLNFVNPIASGGAAAFVIPIGR